MDDLHQTRPHSNKEALELEAARRVRGEEERVVCEAIAVKDCHPSPYDRQALAFRRGDRIEVIRMGPTGIWRGRCRGREGNFKFIDVATSFCHFLDALGIPLGMHILPVFVSSIILCNYPVLNCFDVVSV